MIATNNGSFPWRTPDTPDRLEGVALDRVTREAIDAQIRAGLDLVTDGLVRRTDPVTYVTGSLEGIAPGEERQGLPGSGGSYRVPVVLSEVAWKKPILTEDFLFAKGGSSRTSSRCFGYGVVPNNPVGRTLLSGLVGQECPTH